MRQGGVAAHASDISPGSEWGERGREGEEREGKDSVYSSIGMGSHGRGSESLLGLSSL